MQLLVILLLSFFLMLPLFSAPDVGTKDGEIPATQPAESGEIRDDGISVRKGKVRVDKLLFPVFPGVQVVDKSSFGGIRYLIQEQSPAAALAKAKKIQAFYKGKKVGGARFGKFKKFGSPQRNAWYAAGKAKGKRPIVAVMVHENEITVHVIPNGDSETLVLLL